MLESLVAITISSLMAFALVNMVCETLRTMNRATKDAQAYELVEELTEYTRAYGYDHLLQFSGQPVTLTLNGETGSSYENEVLQNRPILLDFVKKSWRPKSFSKRFNGTVTYWVFEGPEAGTLNVAIDAHWVDANTAQEKSLGRVIIVIDT